MPEVIKCQKVNSNKQYKTFISFIREKVAHYSYEILSEEIIKISILDPGYLVTYMNSVKLSLSQMNVLWRQRLPNINYLRFKKEILWVSISFVGFILSIGYNANFNHKHNSHIIFRHWQYVSGPNWRIIFFIFKKWLLIFIFMSLWFDILDVPISQRQKNTKSSRISKKRLSKIMDTHTYTQIFVYTVNIRNFSNW